jgi:DNA mismatch endonuclease, patch repair protein
VEAKVKKKVVKISKEGISRIMKGNRSKNTRPELLFRQELWRRKLRGYRIHSKGLPGKPDVVFTKVKVAIFINGCFWHRCPYCDPHYPETNVSFWNEKFKRNKARDASNRKILEDSGWKVFTFWECEILSNKEECIKLIKCSHKL